MSDRDVFELMQQNGDYTHFYFAYRWFLLDLKRGMCLRARVCVHALVHLAVTVDDKIFVLRGCCLSVMSGLLSSMGYFVGSDRYGLACFAVQLQILVWQTKWHNQTTKDHADTGVCMQTSQYVPSSKAGTYCEFWKMFVQNVKKFIQG